MADQISMNDWINSSINASAERAHTILDAAADFPIRTSLTLIARAKTDPTHVRVIRCKGEADRYELVFSDKEKKEIEANFINLRKDSWKAPPDWLEQEAENFSIRLQGAADFFCRLEECMPDDQEARREKFRQLDTALNRVNELINSMDSAALGYFVATAEKDGGDPSLMNDPPIAMAAAGKLKTEITERITEACRNSTKSCRRITRI